MCIRDSSTPASPTYIEETRNARALYWMTCTPMTAEATSLSRSVCMARPGRLPQQVAVVQPGQNGQGQAEVPQPLDGTELDVEHEKVRVAVGEAEPEQAEWLGVAPVEAAGFRAQHVDQQVLAEEDQPDGGDAQVDAAESAGDRAEQQPGQPGEQYGEHRRDRRRQTEAGQLQQSRGRAGTGEVAVAVSTDGEEEAVGQRQLPRRTD